MLMDKKILLNNYLYPITHDLNISTHCKIEYLPLFLHMFCGMSELTSLHMQPVILHNFRGKVTSVKWNP